MSVTGGEDHGPRVVVADDHPPTRAAVRQALEHQRWTVVADVDTAAAAVSAARELHPDACLIDIRLPGGGIAAAGAIHRALPDVAIVMLTDSDGDGELVAALRAGASGYLLTSTDPPQLATQLRRVLDGQAILPLWLVGRLVREVQSLRARRLPARQGQPAQLTPRETEVLELLVTGATTDEMARKLLLAPVTVRAHVAAILRKLRVPDRAAAIALVRGRYED